MELKEAESTDLERVCQAVSPNDEPCDYPATVHCAKCGRWFCDAMLRARSGRQVIRGGEA